MKRKLKLLTCMLLVAAMVSSAQPVFGQTAKQDAADTPQNQTGPAFLEGLMMDSDVEPITIKPPKKAQTSSATPKAQKADWAVCIYMCGTDLESGQGSATLDLLEMLMADIPDNVKLMVMTGGTKTWDPSNMADAMVKGGFLKEGAYIQPKSDETQLYEVDDDQMTLVKEYGSNLNMGDAKTAAKFVQDCLTYAPAERMMLSFWNHGGGPISGVAFDEYTDDSLSLQELKAVLSALQTARGGEKAELLGFDACLMNNLETASMLAPYADYMVASEEVEPGYGWDYSWLTELEKEYSDRDGIATLEAEEVGRAIVDHYAYSMNEEGDWSQVKGETLALVDLSRMEALKTAFNEMAYKLCKIVAEDETFAAVSRIAEKAQRMMNGTGLIDLYDFARDVLPYVPEAQDVLDVLGASPGTDPAHYVGEVSGTNPAVLYRGTGLAHNESLGMAFFYPTARDEIDSSSGGTYTQFYRTFEISDFYTAYLMNVMVMSDKLRSFEGKLQASYDEKASHYVMQVENPDDALSLKSVQYLNLYTELSGGKVKADYLLGTNMVQEDWDKARFTEQFDGLWYTIGGTLCSMDMKRFEGNDQWEAFTIPIVAEGEDAVSQMTAYHSLQAEEAGEFYVYIDSITAPSSAEDGSSGAPRTYTPEGDFTFHTVLQKYDFNKQQVTGYTLSDAVTISPDAETGMYLLSDKMERQQLKSGQSAVYTGYFQATDLRNQTVLSDPCSYVLLENFAKDLTIQKIPAQTYTGKPIKPRVRLLFLGEELLKEGVDYKVEYKNNVKKGKATVIVTSLMEDLPGRITTQFEIKDDPNKALITSVKKSTIKAAAKVSKKEKCIQVSWKKSGSVKVSYYEVFRSTHKNSGYGTKPSYKKAAKGKQSGQYKDRKGLKKGKTYYYKVRGVRTIGGKKIYTKWSNIVSKKAV